jgi:hypothetical protein
VACRAPMYRVTCGARATSSVGSHWSRHAWRVDSPDNSPLSDHPTRQLKIHPTISSPTQVTDKISARATDRTSEDHEHMISRTEYVTREYVRWLDRARVTTVFRWWRVCPVSTQATCGNLGGQISGLGFPAAPPPSRRHGPAKPSSLALSSDIPKRVCLRDSGVPETQ